jgi:hypothetical protein
MSVWVLFHFVYNDVAGVQRPGRVVYHSSPFGAEVNTVWKYASTPSIRLSDVDRNTFTFILQHS